MDKRELKQIPMMQMPENTVFSNESDSKIQKKRYAYLANKHTAGGEKILAVTFFSQELRIPKFRIFFNRDSFVVEKLHPKQKWSNGSLDMSPDLYYKDYCSGTINTTELVLKFFKASGDPIDAMIDFQRGLREKKLNAKHKIIEDGIDAELEKTEMLPKNLNKWIDNEVFRFSSYIYYKRRNKKRVDGYCTICRKDIELDFARHNEHGVCPNCNSEVTFKAIGKSTQIIDESKFYYVQKYDSGIMVRFFTTRKKYFSHYRTPEISFFETDRIIYKDNQYFKYYFGLFLQKKHRWCKGGTGVANYSWRNFSYDEGLLYPDNLNQVFENTPWQYSQLDKFAELKKPLSVFAYINNFILNPKLEYIVKMGLFNIAKDYGSYSFDEDIKFIFENKRYLPLFRDLDIADTELNFVRKLMAKGIAPTKDLVIWGRENEMLNSIDTLLNICGLQKGINYIEKHRKKRSFKDALALWTDYLQMCKELKYNINEDIIKFPKYLIKSHDEITKELKNKKEKERIKALQFEEEQIQNQAESLNKTYYYETKKFLIRAPKNRAEIVNEGQELSHCVFSYTGRVARGETIILFVRERTKPTKPFYTLELANGEVRQCMGKYHKEMTAPVKDFVDKWFSEKVEKMQLSGQSSA